MRVNILVVCVALDVSDLNFYCEVNRLKRIFSMVLITLTITVIAIALGYLTLWGLDALNPFT